MPRRRRAGEVVSKPSSFPSPSLGKLKSGLLNWGFVNRIGLLSYFETNFKEGAGGRSVNEFTFKITYCFIDLKIKIGK